MTRKLKVLWALNRQAKIFLSNFKHKMKRLQIPQKLVYEKFYVHKKILLTRNCRRTLIQIYFLKNAKKTGKPNNCDLNRDWIKLFALMKTLIMQRQSSKENWYQSLIALFPDHNIQDNLFHRVTFTKILVLFLK